MLTAQGDPDLGPVVAIYSSSSAKGLAHRATLEEAHYAPLEIEHWLSMYQQSYQTTFNRLKRLHKNYKQNKAKNLINFGLNKNCTRTDVFAVSWLSFHCQRYTGSSFSFNTANSALLLQLRFLPFHHQTWQKAKSSLQHAAFGFYYSRCKTKPKRNK